MKKRISRSRASAGGRLAKRVALTVALLVVALTVIPVFLKQLLFKDSPGRALTGVTLDTLDYSDVSFRQVDEGLSLGGMLFEPDMPDDSDPIPGVVVIHGSGDSHRENWWYLTLVEFLQRHGIAVLLPDKLGCGRSEGEWKSAGISQLAADASAAIDFLVAMDSPRIAGAGVIGMSQGGMVAPVAAGINSNIRFVVNVVGSATTIRSSLLFEEKHNLRGMGVLPGIADILAYPSSWSIIHLRQAGFWKAVGRFDPRPAWERLEVPALALYGADDTNTPGDRSARILRSLKNPDLTVKVYDGSGHSLESPEGEGSSVLRLDALEDIRDFIHACCETE